MANSDFKLTSEQIQHEDMPVTVFHLRGWLDAQSETSLFNAAEEAHHQGAHHLVLNLEEIQMLTSAGIRAIQKVYKLFQLSETSGMRLCNAPPQVYHALAITGFLQTVPMYENLKAALSSYKM